jgi:hypothetical protein
MPVYSQFPDTPILIKRTGRFVPPASRKGESSILFLELFVAEKTAPVSVHSVDSVQSRLHPLILQIRQ